MRKFVSRLSVLVLNLLALVSNHANALDYIYVANSNTHNISMYQFSDIKNKFILSPLKPATVRAGINPQQIAITPSGHFLYATNSGDNSVSMYSVDLKTGLLTPLKPTAVESGEDPIGIAVSPSGQYVYVTNSSDNIHIDDATDNSVYVYKIDQNLGLLKLVEIVHAGAMPARIAITPSGRYAYVSNAGSNNISMYRIDKTTGKLSSLGTTGPIANPAGLAIDAAGARLYVASFDSLGFISVYEINPQTGKLNYLHNKSVRSYPLEIALAPNSNFLYVTNPVSSNAVSMYSTSPNFLYRGLNNVDNTNSRAIAINSANNYAYAISSDNGILSVYKIIKEGDAIGLWSNSPIAKTKPNKTRPTGIAIYSVN